MTVPGEQVWVDGPVRLEVVTHHRTTPGNTDLVIIPGITMAAPSCDFIARPLLDLRRVHVVSLRGRGLSGRAPTGAHTLADHASDVVAVIDQLGLDHPDLLGLSLGARVAAHLATQLPDSLGTTILVDPPVSGPGRRPYPTSAAEFVEQVAEGRSPDARVLLSRRFPHWSHDAVRTRAEELRRCDLEAIAESHRGFHEEDFHELWERLVTRAALIRGADSPVVTAADVAELARANPAIPITTVPDAGHLVAWDNPAAFLSAVRHHLTEGS